MKYFESVLKVWFLTSATGFYFVQESSCWLKSLAVSSIILGITLIFNKNHSYGWYKISHREVILRKIEGVILIIFGTVAGCMAVSIF